MTEARPSSTVILSRPGDAAPEFLLVERVSGGAFGGAHVFPGGVLEDVDLEISGQGLKDTDANRILGLERGAVAYYSAAVRELFEETAILLVDTKISTADRLSLRAALLDRQTSWPSMLNEHQLTPSLTHLRYVSFWVTPQTLPRRFATRFFFAASPVGQDAVVCGRELESAAWLTAKDALGRAARGELMLHPPTQLTLKELQNHTSVSALSAWALRREAGGVPCIEPASADPSALRQAMDALR